MNHREEFEVEHRVQMAAADAAEIAAAEFMRALFAVVAQECAPSLFRIWDGEGAWMHHVLDEALEAAGFVRSVPQPRVNPRGHISAKLRREVFERDRYRCRGCSDWHDLAVDHIIPVSRGGESVLENLQTLCRPCNSSKGTKMPEVAEPAH